MDIIKINIVEVATELADEVVRAKYEDDDFELFEIEVNDVDEDTPLVYKEEPQKLFNEWYDHYYNLLWDLKQE